ncbi:hypothetical protein TSUD_341740 [Trifolium subterraneum]|uniref:Uncharacterized protein n=1 Tax=Trifolium subterraneum TaxID=3900 RepID=A0A2Z6NCX6_TRISU|nr:hypothetical protein TSUD_341740 [Trifolium subterraneum]
MQTNLVEMRLVLVGRTVTRLLMNWLIERCRNGISSRRVPYIRAVKLAVKLFMVLKLQSNDCVCFWIKKKKKQKTRI